RVLVSLPVVDGVAGCARAERLHRLTETTVRDAVVRAEFDENLRLEQVDESHAEGQVLHPGGSGQTEWVGKTDGMLKRVKAHRFTSLTPFRKFQDVPTST